MPLAACWTILAVLRNLLRICPLRRAGPGLRAQSERGRYWGQSELTQRSEASERHEEARGH